MTMKHEIELAVVDGHGLERARDLWRCTDCGAEVWIEAPARERPDTHAWLQAAHLAERNVRVQLTKMVGRYWPGTRFSVAGWHGSGEPYVVVDINAFGRAASRVGPSAVLAHGTWALVDPTMPGEHRLEFHFEPDRSYEPMGDDVVITCSTCEARMFVDAPYEFDAAWVNGWQDLHLAELEPQPREVTDMTGKARGTVVFAFPVVAASDGGVIISERDVDDVKLMASSMAMVLGGFVETVKIEATPDQFMMLSYGVNDTPESGT